MKTYTKFLIIIIAIAMIAVNGCAQNLDISATPESPTVILATSTSTQQNNQTLQLENNLPLTPLSPKRSRELMDNHIGVHFEDYDRYSDTEHVYKVGFKWVRIQSLTEFWGEGYGLKTFALESIPPEVDDIINDYIDNDVNIVLDLWLGADLRPIGAKFQSEVEINRYLDYVRFVISHFKGRISHYQIWNEPGDVAVSDYANLVERVVPVIRELDPDAKVIVPGMHGNWDNGYPGYGEFQRFSLNMGYLNELIQSGIAPLVDGISFHPFYGNMPEDPYYQDYPDLLQEIKDLAESHGFTGEYYADELLWATVTEVGWDGGPPLTRPIAAKYYTRAIAMHRGLDVNVTINTFFQDPFLSPIHNICDTLAGAEPTDITMSIGGDAASAVHYAFVLPDGDKLVAVWMNGEVVEDDPGVSANLTIDSISTQRVIGIDVFNGLEQELIVKTENGNLIIRNLLVKDYPIIIKFTDSASP